MPLNDRRRTAQWSVLAGLLITAPALVRAEPEPDPDPAARAAAAGPAAPAAAPMAEEGALQEIVVTSTRKEENLSRVPISVTALTQEAIDTRGIKDFQDVARFTPGVDIDNSGTNNISIRGIASTGGAGTTGIYLDDTPIQIRALAFNPDDALPKSFDLERIEVLRGPQGTLFGAGSEGGTVRYITTQPSLTQTSFYSRDEVSYTQDGKPSYEVGVAGGMPVIDGTLGIRVSAWYRYDGGYINWIDPVTLQPILNDANYQQTKLLRVAAVWKVAENWTVTPSYYYQDSYRNNTNDYWSIYSNPNNGSLVSADPTQHQTPDVFYLPALKIQGDLGKVMLISNTSYYQRAEQTGYDGTLYNLGFYQAQPTLQEYQQSNATPVFPHAPWFGDAWQIPYPLLDGNGLHLNQTNPYNGLNPSSYRSPASVNNGQQNFTQELRLQSTDPSSRLSWTTGLFFSENHQYYLEQIHDPQLNMLSLAVTGQPYTNWFTSYATGNPVLETTSGPYAYDSYYLSTAATDKQLAWFGDGTYEFTDQWKADVGLRLSRNQFFFNTYTGGPQLFLEPQFGTATIKETSFTPKVNVSYQQDPHDLYYFTYAKGFRPGGGNNPVPAAACGSDFSNFGIKEAPQTYSSDTVDSFEIGAKNNIDNRFKIASSVYLIKWHNIQQTVVPPICQISFIDNLGAATAKGADVQIDWAMTNSLQAELAVGYTDARYTQNSVLSSTEAQPIVSSGDAITGQSGQPASPFTLAIGLEYKFTAFSRESFVRVDDEYESRPKWASPQQDPTTQQYQSVNYTLPATNFMSLRGGMDFGGWQIAAFIDNLLYTHVVTNYDFTINPQYPNPNGGSQYQLERNYTYRPRTFGLTFTYRH